MLARSIQSISDVKFKEFNLQRGQFIFLTRVCENPGFNQIDLSNLLKVDKTTTTKAIQKLIDDIFESIDHYDSCAGLAASQLDLDIVPAPRLFVMNRPPEEGGALCFINPEIIAMEGKDCDPEGCMSVGKAEIALAVERANKVTVKALDRHGKSFNVELKDFWAHCIQHELDHLNGVLILDRVSSLKRERAKKKIKEILNSKF